MIYITLGVIQSLLLDQMGIKVQPTANHHYATGYSAETTGKETGWSNDFFFDEFSSTSTSKFVDTRTHYNTNSSSRSRVEARILTDRVNLISHQTGSSFSTKKVGNSERGTGDINSYSSYHNYNSTSGTKSMDFSHTTGSSFHGGTAFNSGSDSRSFSAGGSSKRTGSNGETIKVSTKYESFYESSGSYRTYLATAAANNGFTNYRKIYPDGEPSRFARLVRTNEQNRSVTKEVTYASVRNGSIIERNYTLNEKTRGIGRGGDN